MSEFNNNHKIITNRSTIVSELTVVNEKLHNAGFSFKWDKGDDSGMVEYDKGEIPDNVLMVIGSFDFCYYYTIEFVFHGLVFSSIATTDSWPDHWNKPQLELLDDAACRTYALQHNIEYTTNLLMFAFNIGSFTDLQHIIIAKGFSYHILE